MPLPRIQTNILNNLVRSGRLSDEQADSLFRSDADMSGNNLDKVLLEELKVQPLQLLVAKAQAYELPPFNLRSHHVTDRNFEFVDRDDCKEHRILPVAVLGDHLLLATADPFNLAVISKIQESTRKRVTTMLALESDLEQVLADKEKTPVAVGFSDVMDSLQKEFGAVGENLDDSDIDLEEESAPIVQLSSRIIEEAYYAGGSDIHIEPFENDARVRVRVDGVCMEKLRIPPKVCTSLLARLKVMANLDIAEKRIPQDGRIVYKQFNKKGIDVDLRVATAPLNHGEGVVMRILDKQKSTLPLTALGFSEENLKVYRNLIERPYGMILHCGPTGSGKSMTLYSALNEINTPDVCIRTAEDPIEYTLPGLCQMQMHRQIGLTFASALRAFLRQDPDIILVGEIRDPETAQIAIEAALTGHLLFSTLHTNDAPSTISRLTEMDIEPFMISASLICVCAQRLLRRVCKSCKQAYMPGGREDLLLQRAINWSGSVFAAKGCPACGGNGYKGRVGIHELMATSEDLIKAINAGYDTARLKRVAIRNGMRTLHQDSILKVKDGITTIQEAIANVPPDLEDIAAILSASSMEEALIAGIAT